MLFARLLYQSGGRTAKAVSASLRTGPRRIATGAAAGALYAGITSDANTEDSILRSMIGGAIMGGAIGLGTTKAGWNMAKGLLGRAGSTTGIPQEFGRWSAGRSAARVAAGRQPLMELRREQDIKAALIQKARQRFAGSYQPNRFDLPRAERMSRQFSPTISETTIQKWATQTARQRAAMPGYATSARAMARATTPGFETSLAGRALSATQTGLGIMASRPGLAMLGAGGVVGGMAMASPNRQPIGAEAVPFAQGQELPGGGTGLDLAGPVLPPNRTVKRRMLRAMRRQEQVNASRQQRRDDSMAMLQGSTYGMVQGMNASRHRGG